MLLVETPGPFSSDEEWAEFAKLLASLPSNDPDVIRARENALEIFKSRQRDKTLH